MKSTRRTFFKQIAGFAFLSGGLQMFLSACGGGGSSSYSTSGSQTSTNTGTGTGTSTATAAVNCGTNGATVTIGTNHGHSAPVIAAADVTAGTQKQYSLGPSDSTGYPPNHIHTATLTAAAFGSLQGNAAQTVTTDADSTGHTHLLSIGCA